LPFGGVSKVYSVPAIPFSTKIKPQAQRAAKTQKIIGRAGLELKQNAITQHYSFKKGPSKEISGRGQVKWNLILFDG